MNDKNLEQKAKNQTEVNKIFLKACMNDDIDMVKYLLNSKEIPINAQLNINKITGAAKKKKVGFYHWFYVCNITQKRSINIF